jgi:hypothetical protein
MNSYNEAPITQVIIYVKFGIISNKHTIKNLLKHILNNKRNLLINNYAVSINAVHKNDETKMHKLMKHKIDTLPALSVNDQMIFGVKNIMDVIDMFSAYNDNSGYQQRADKPRKKKTGAQMIDDLVKSEIEKHKNEVDEEDESMGGSPTAMQDKVQKEMQKRKQKQGGKEVNNDIPEVDVVEVSKPPHEDKPNVKSTRGHKIKPPLIKPDEDDDIMTKHMKNIGLKKKK